MSFIFIGSIINPTNIVGAINSFILIDLLERLGTYILLQLSIAIIPLYYLVLELIFAHDELLLVLVHS